MLGISLVLLDLVIKSLLLLVRIAENLAVSIGFLHPLIMLLHFRVARLVFETVMALRVVLSEFLLLNLLEFLECCQIVFAASFGLSALSASF